jgi:hypothetical protein
MYEASSQIDAQAVSLPFRETLARMVVVPKV